MDPSSKTEAVLKHCFTVSKTTYFGVSLFTKHLAESNNIRFKKTKTVNWHYIIQGHKCAEFNLRGNSVQPLYETNCSQYIPHVHSDILHWLLINTKCAIYRKTVKRLKKKVSKLIEKMMGLKKILVSTVCGLI